VTDRRAGVTELASDEDFAPKALMEQAPDAFGGVLEVLPLAGEAVELAPVDYRSGQAAWIETRAAGFQCGAVQVSEVPTGIVFRLFAPSASATSTIDPVFAGCIDWMPNIDEGLS
jgi:hypothetical protein